ncbi:hypothetical protein C4D60_Mb05t07510 [Musa balbisiana]|uniref:Uncharacterized protein n=1 Tax=Musa balbisiana TaxID=52838 RepID=A0A4S8JUD5_MUSBA|nr:hypothetical protein C4D60_Mb05t07510 [Musa balbisiana]
MGLGSNQGTVHIKGIVLDADDALHQPLLLVVVNRFVAHKSLHLNYYFYPPSAHREATCHQSGLMDDSLHVFSEETLQILVLPFSMGY